MKTINEVYEELKRKRDNAKIELNKVYELANDFLKHFDIKSGVDMFIKNSRLVGEVNAYAYAVALIESSGVLEEEKIKDEALEQQLAEKDKEIEDYNNYFKSFGCKNFAEFQELIGLSKISANDKERDDIIRKQVCDEIRNALTSIEPNCTIEDMNSNLYEFTGEEIYAILDQIEKGSNNE